MFVVLNTNVPNTSQLTFGKRRDIPILDLDDLIIETINLDDLSDIINKVGIDMFLNVMPTLDNTGYIIKYISTLSDMEKIKPDLSLKIGSLCYKDGVLTFKNKKVIFYSESTYNYLFISGVSYKAVWHNSEQSRRYPIQYIERIKENNDIILLHYLVNGYKLTVIIDINGNLLGVAGINDFHYKVHKCDKSLLRLATKLTMLRKDNGWWNYLIKEMA